MRRLSATGSSPLQASGGSGRPSPIMRALIRMTLLSLTACTGAQDGGGDCNGEAKTPPNLMTNGGFECGTTAPGWVGQNGTLTIVAEGASAGTHAAKVVLDASGTGGIATMMPVVIKTTGKKYCANGKVKGTISNVRFEVIGSLLTSFASPVSSADAWLRLPPATNVPPAPNLVVEEPVDQSLYVKIHADGGKAGDTLFIDEVDLWESTDGKCKER